MTIAEERPDRAELVGLYEDVGWTAYTRDPDRLVAAVEGSHRVFTARDGALLVGLVRTVSDGETIVYVQDLLVAAGHRRSGVGGRLLDTVLEQYATIRQTVLTTDAQLGQRAFYESRGFVEAHEVAPAPLRSFVLLR